MVKINGEDRDVAGMTVTEYRLIIIPKELR